MQVISEEPVGDKSVPISSVTGILMKYYIISKSVVDKKMTSITSDIEDGIMSLLPYCI